MQKGSEILGFGRGRGNGDRDKIQEGMESVELERHEEEQETKMIESGLKRFQSIYYSLEHFQD